MLAFEQNQEERKIAQEIKKKFDKDYSKWAACVITVCAFS